MENTLIASRKAPTFGANPSGLAASTAAPAQAATALSEQEALDIAVEAYVYLYPLITMDLTRRVVTNLEAGQKPAYGPANAFSHIRSFPPADFREVVRPNFDTLYSTAWLDLTNGPVIVSTPDMGGRYFLLPMLDMWTDVFAVPGKRTSGTAAADYAIVPPNWSGALPAGIERIDAPTPYVWIIGRTQTNGPADYAAVNRVQDGYRITPLAQWGKPASPAKVVVDPTVDMKTEPLRQVNEMPAGKYFAYGMALAKINPPHPTDWSQLARMKRLGLEPGKPFDLTKADPLVRSALQAAPAAAMQAMLAKIPTVARVVNGWQMNTDTMGVYGDFYLKRAIIALVGLGANQPEDAIYPLNIADATGKPMGGSVKYVLHFDKAQLPPVSAFWSVTMYDAEGFQTPNALIRFAVGDRDALQYNADGSLDIYIQSASPGAGKESNWLPSPASGPLGVTMRLYGPKAPALDGRWAPPPVRPVG